MKVDSLSMLPDHGALAVGHGTSPVCVLTAMCGMKLDYDVFAGGDDRFQRCVISACKQVLMSV